MSKGQENLIPFNELTKEEQRQLAIKGGTKSGEVRRARKTLKEELLLLLETNNTQNNVTIALLKQAEKGNTKAFEILRDTIGEKPTDKTETKTEVTINDEDKALLNNLYDRLK